MEQVDVLHRVTERSLRERLAAWGHPLERLQQRRAANPGGGFRGAHHPLPREGTEGYRGELQGGVAELREQRAVVGDNAVEDLLRLPLVSAQRCGVRAGTLIATAGSPTSIGCAPNSRGTSRAACGDCCAATEGIGTDYAAGVRPRNCHKRSHPLRRTK